MRIVVAGASGFLGSHLVTELTGRGHEVVRLVRRPATVADESEWDPYNGVVDQQVVDGADAVVNLAASPTFGNPHSKKWAHNLRTSRVTTTRVLAESVAAAPRPPAFVNGQAIGWYGDHRDEVITEESDSRGSTFVTKVCRDWEDAAGPAVGAGGRVALLRAAPIIDRKIAPLKLQVPLFRIGLGSRLGNGSQYFSVISLQDWVGAAAFVVEHDSLAGPVNLSCPVPPTNREYTDALARNMGRRARLAVPAMVIEKAAGVLASEAVGSMRVEPTALLAAGFTFRNDDVDAVLRAALG